MAASLIRALLAAAATLAVLTPVSAASAASLTLGTANTANAPTTLTGNTSAGPELKIVNTNTAQPALRAEATGAGAGAFALYGILTATAPGASSAAVRGESHSTNALGYGVFGSHAGGGTGVYGTAATGIGVFGTHTSASGASPAVRGDSASTATGAYSVYGLLLPASPGASSSAVRGENKGTNANGFGVWGSHAGSGVGVYGTSVTGRGMYARHVSTSGSAPALQAESSSPTAPGVFGVNLATGSSGTGVYGQQNGEGIGVYGSVPSNTLGSGGQGVLGRRGSTAGLPVQAAGVWGDSFAGMGLYGTSSKGSGVYGLSATFVGVYARSNGSGGAPGLTASSASGSGVEGTSVTFGKAGVYGENGAPFGYGISGKADGSQGEGVHGSSNDPNGSGVYGLADAGHGVTGIAQLSGGTGVYGEDDSSTGFGVRGINATGMGVRGESESFQGVSGTSVHNAGVYGETTGDGFAAYFVGPTEQHGRLNTYDAQIRVAHGGGALSDTSAALQAEQEGSSGEAGWLRLSDAANTNAVLMLIKQASGTGDFLKCYNQSGPGSYSQKCHVDANGTFVSGSDFAESLPARGDRAAYEPGDVLSMSTARPGQVVRSTHARDRALIGVYSTRPAVLGADKGGVTRVGKNDVPVAITGIVPVKVTAQNGAIRPGDLLTSSSRPGRAMNAGRSPAIGTVLGKALGELEHGTGTIKMLVMLR